MNLRQEDIDKSKDELFEQDLRNFFNKYNNLIKQGKINEKNINNIRQHK
jgi:hypothetical protein